MMKEDFIILAGIVGLYFLTKSAKSGPSVNCPGAPACPGASADNACPLGYSSYTTYDPSTDSFSMTCQALQQS